jgi:hypothetical protein
MSANERRAAALALAILGIALAARHGSAAPANQPTANADGLASGTTTSKPTAQRLSGSQTKPVGPIAIVYEFSTPPELGVPFEVRISAAGSGAIGDLELTVVADDGLEAGAPQLTSGSADGSQRDWTVPATGYKNGTLYLTLLVQGTVGDQHPSRALVIPIHIGVTTAASSTAAASSISSSHGRVIVMQSDAR